MEKRSGFTLVEIVIVVAIIAILAAIAIPQLITSRKVTRQNRCLHNLKIVERAKEQEFLASGRSSGQNISASALDDFIEGGTIPLCPITTTPPYSNCRVLGLPTSCDVHGTVTNPTPISNLTD